jgi:hypothetical protein
MPVVADFKVISDGKVTLKWNSPNSAKTFNFSLPGLAGSQAVLSFVCIAHGNTGNLGNVAFEMFLNGTSQLSYGFAGFEILTLQEVISGSGLSSSSNELFIKMLSGDGQLDVSDVVLWYKRTV